MIIKKKLKDLTEKEYNIWCEENCLKQTCKNCIFKPVQCEDTTACWIKNKDLYSDKFLDQEIEIEVLDVLTEKEKEYLNTIIEPFRDRIQCIIKSYVSGYEYIYIKVKSLLYLNTPEPIVFPVFEKDTMYKNMEINKEYTIEELGL